VSTGRETRKPLSALVREHAEARGLQPAYIEPERSICWRDYDALSDRFAMRLLDAGLQRGERVALFLPDGIELHAALLGAEKAGLIALGIGARAGQREVRHLVKLAGAAALVTMARHREDDMGELFAELRAQQDSLRVHVVLAPFSADDRAIPLLRREALLPLALGADDIFLLNSTSGTTGMPKCVVHDQARWYAFHDEAQLAAEFSPHEVFMSVAPPPFGFGIWTSHTTPTILGAPTVIMPRFEARQALQLIERHRVTILAAVSTQFIMLLNQPEFSSTDFTSLRALFTGGEMVPYPRALDFEQRTGAAVLQFYGSNETGAFSKTTIHDAPEQRLTTAGRLLPSMEVRLFDDTGSDVTASGRGQPGGRGPLLSRGYYNDDAANAKLFGPDHFMLMEDIVEIDAGGYLRVAGRKGDFIIRGGKNISCAAVEEACGAHPRIALAAAVAAPDPVFGERTMLFVATHDGGDIGLTELTDFLASNKVSRELYPEYLLVRTELPRSSGEKIAKHVLREEAKQYVAGLVAN
jgi:acyl-CoA synthetase